MSQVKNLLAVFEQKKGASPPDRGRVQTLSDHSDSSRPLSRVRASFIAVEKDGRVGLQRDPSADSFLSSTQKTSTPETPSRKVAVSPPAVQPIQVEVDSKPSTPVKRTALATGQPRPVQTPKQPAPMFALVEPARAVEPPKTPVAEKTSAPEPTLAATPKVQAPEAEKALPPTPAVATAEKVDKEKPENKPGDKQQAKPQERPQELEVVSEAPSEPEASADAPSKAAATVEPAERQTTPAKPKPVPSVPAVVDTAQQEPTRADASGSAGAAVFSGATTVAGGSETATKVAKPGRTSPSSIPMRTKAPKSTKDAHSTVAAKTSTKTNALKAITTTKTAVKPTLKTPTSPPKPLTPRLAAFTPETKAPAVAEKAGKSATPVSAVSSAPSSTKKLPSIDTSFPPNGVGFVKPKPKSPTRPIQLPPSLTAHTASSATKFNVPRQSLSRMLGNISHAPSQVRSPSRVSISSVATTTVGGKTLKRQSSTVGRSRPSIGPPPKQPARDHPAPKKEKEVDESFLARMMRPTQASALKAADRVQLQQRKGANLTAKKPALQRKSGLPRAVGSTSGVKKHGTSTGPTKDTSHPVETSVVVKERAEEAPVDQVLDAPESAPESAPENTPDVSKADGSEGETLLGDVDASSISATKIELGHEAVAVEN